MLSFQDLNKGIRKSIKTNSRLRIMWWFDNEAALDDPEIIKSCVDLLCTARAIYQLYGIELQYKSAK